MRKQIEAYQGTVYIHTHLVIDYPIVCYTAYTGIPFAGAIKAKRLALDALSRRLEEISSEK